MTRSVFSECLGCLPKSRAHGGAERRRMPDSFPGQSAKDQGSSPYKSQSLCHLLARGLYKSQSLCSLLLTKRPYKSQLICHLLLTERPLQFAALVSSSSRRGGK